MTLRNTKRKNSFGYLAISLTIFIGFILAVGGCGTKQAGQEGSKVPSPQAAGKISSVSMGTGSIGSPIYALGIAMGEILKEKKVANISNQPIGGSDAIFQLMLEKKMDLGFTNSVNVSENFQGKGLSKTQVPLRVIFEGHSSFRYLVARKDSGIKSVADLKGKRLLGKRPGEVTIEQAANALLKAYNISPQDVRMITTTETNEAVDALKMGSADAAILPGGSPLSNLMDLAQSTDITLISIPQDKISTVLANLGPGYEIGPIPPNTYKGQSSAVNTIYIPQTLVCRVDLPEDLIYQITKALEEGQEEIAKNNKLGKFWTAKNTLSLPAPAPYHPGTVKYFKELNLWTQELEKTQESLLKLGK